MVKNAAVAIGNGRGKMVAEKKTGEDIMAAFCHVFFRLLQQSFQFHVIEASIEVYKRKPSPPGARFQKKLENILLKHHRRKAQSDCNESQTLQFHTVAK